MRKHILTILAVLVGIITLGASPANATLSRVGPALSSSPSVAKGQVQSLIRHDEGVRTFVVRQSDASASAFASAEVTHIKKTRCTVGRSKTCRYNTGKDASGNLRTTTYRHGTRVSVYVVTVTYDKGKSVKMTFIIPCANVMGVVKTGHTRQRVSIRKKITVKVSSWAEAVCAGGVAKASASATVKVRSWSAFAKAVSSAKASCAPAAPVVAQTCDNGQTNTTASGAACQSNSSSSSATVETTQSGKQQCEAKGGVWNNSSVCTIINNNTTIINQTTVQVNANCSKVIITYGDGSSTTQWQNATGNVVTENYCSTSTQPPVQPPVAENQAPKCEPYKVPQHVYPRMGFVIEVSCEDPDGDPITVTPSVRRGKLIPISQTGTTYRYQYTAPDTVGDDTVTFRVKDSKGLAGEPLVVTFANPYDER